MENIYNVITDGRRMSCQKIIDSIAKSRGVKEIDEFLDPKRDNLIPLTAFEYASKGYEIISDTVGSNGTFLIYYDCDMDGQASGTIMYNYLKHFTDNIKRYVNEGKAHGISKFDLNNLEGVDTLIIVDSIDEHPEYYQRILDKGVKIIVLDHHVPDRCILNIKEDICLISSAHNYPNPELSGAGVCLKFCLYVDMVSGNNFAEELFDLAAAGIIGDVCSVGPDAMENRYICHKGFNDPYNEPLKNIIGNYETNSNSMAFSVAPLINSGNRMNKNDICMQLLSSEDTHEIMEDIKILKKCKEEQNEIAAKTFESIKEQAKDQMDKKCMTFIVEEEGNENMIGLIASKALGEYKRPVMVLRKCEKEGQYRGSMRATGIDDFSRVINSTGIGRCAGHENSAGVFVDIDALEDFINAIEYELRDVKFEQVFDVDLQLKESQITLELIKELKNINKISGKNFPAVQVMIDDITGYEIGNMSKGKHLKITTPDGLVLIYWNFTDWDSLQKGKSLKAVGTLDCSFFGRTMTRQLIMNSFEFEEPIELDDL